MSQNDKITFGVSRVCSFRIIPKEKIGYFVQLDLDHLIAACTSCETDSSFLYAVALKNTDISYRTSNVHIFRFSAPGQLLR